MEDLIALIANVGFPIVISLYLLVRIEDKLGELSNSILGLSEVINKLV